MVEKFVTEGGQTQSLELFGADLFPHLWCSVSVHLNAVHHLVEGTEVLALVCELWVEFLIELSTLTFGQEEVWDCVSSKTTNLSDLVDSLLSVHNNLIITSHSTF